MEHCMEQRLGKHSRCAHSSQSVQVRDSCAGHSWSITLMIPRRLSSETLQIFGATWLRNSLVRGTSTRRETTCSAGPWFRHTPIDEYLCSLRARVYTPGVATQGVFRVSFSLYAMYVVSQPYALVQAISVSMRCTLPPSPTLSLNRFQSPCDACRLSALRSRGLIFKVYAMYGAPQPHALVESFSVPMRCMSPFSPALSLTHFQHLGQASLLSTLRSR